MQFRHNFVCWVCLIIACFSGLVLISTAVNIAGPGLIAKNNLETVCQVRDSQLIGTQRCSCGKRCSSSFPCFVVGVDYHVLNKSNQLVKVSSFIHSDETYFENYPKCSFWTCSSNDQRNSEYISFLLNTFGLTNTTYTCLYNQKNVKDVIVTRKYSDSDILVSLLVPASFVFLSGFYPWYLFIKYLRE